VIRPLNSGVILEPMDTPAKTAAGVEIPDTVRARSNEGIVRAIGKGYYHPPTGTYTPLDVKLGDRVLFLRWNGYVVNYEGKQYLRVEENEILCEVEHEAQAELVGKIVSK
jgi:chaperonin GroES